MLQQPVNGAEQTQAATAHLDALTERIDLGRDAADIKEKAFKGVAHPTTVSAAYIRRIASPWRGRVG